MNINKVKKYGEFVEITAPVYLLVLVTHVGYFQNIRSTRAHTLNRITESLKERDILCPTCGFKIQRVFSDATGHLSVKCQKCKNVHILNLAYFRRIRRNGYSRNCRR